MLKGWWQSYNTGGSPDFILAQKMRNMKKDISNWNQEIFGNLEVRRNRALEELAGLEHITENRIPIQFEKQKIWSLSGVGGTSQS